MGQNGNGGDLDGWKEIADYLGRSVRAAQRWEAELGLPVHRMKTSGGQIVYARRDEIDAWRARQEVPPRQSDATADPASEPSTIARDVPAAAPPTRRARRHVVAAVGAGAIAGVVLLASAWRAQRSVLPDSYQFRGNAFVASADGADVWHHDFGRPIIVERPLGVGVTPWPFERVHVVDLDGDGEDEVLAVVSYPAQHEVQADELYCFTPAGKVRWIYRPDDLTLQFGAGIFRAPWFITSVATPPDKGRGNVYVALAHHQWWPSAIMGLAPDGTGHLRMVHAGHLYALSLWDVAGTRRIVAGGVNNEYGAAAVAVLAEDGPVVRSPQSAGAPYACVDCGEDTPFRYFLFEPSELNRSSDSPYNRVCDFQLLNGELGILIHEDPYVPGADSMFRIAGDFRIVDALATDGYWHAHRRHEQLGRLTHRAEECPARRRSVRTFEAGTRWNRQDVALAAPVPGRPAAAR